GGPPFSPRRRGPQGGGGAVQADLRRALARWGLPASIRVDNGLPWGSDDGLPPELACWLIGLGVEVVWNPPYRPQANGVVERSRGGGQVVGRAARRQGRRRPPAAAGPVRPPPARAVPAGRGGAVAVGPAPGPGALRPPLRPLPRGQK